jgi:hypothetical protein
MPLNWNVDAAGVLRINPPTQYPMPHPEHLLHIVVSRHPHVDMPVTGVCRMPLHDGQVSELRKVVPHQPAESVEIFNDIIVRLTFFPRC